MANCNEEHRQSPTIERYKLQYPSAFSVDDKLEMFREWGIDELCFKSLCPVWERAVYLYMAHHEAISPLLFDVNDSTQASGNVKRHHVDDVETEFANVNPIDMMNPKGGFNTTVFGKELLTLMRKYGGMAVLNTSQAKISSCVGGFATGATGGWRDGSGLFK